MNRRRFLSHATAVPFSVTTLCAALQACSGGQTRRATDVALLGQIVIRQAVAETAWPGRRGLHARLAGADVVFANLESVINAPRPGMPTRALLTLHAAEPSALRTLASLPVNLLGTANNHAFDLGGNGIRNTLDALRHAGIAAAGTGEDLSVAGAPACVATPGDTTAVVAFATGMLRPGAAAGKDHIGVNALRRGADGQPHPEDRQRVLSAIRAAAQRAGVVIACHHNHDRGPGHEAVPGWQRDFAHACIDAGATVFVSHGVPVLQGIEIYRATPVFFGLGNFMFQVAKPVGAYEEGTWEGAIALCTFEGRRCTRVRLIPITLDEVGLDGSIDATARGLPTLAAPEQARAILARLGARSAVFGTTIATLSDEGIVAIG